MNVNKSLKRIHYGNFFRNLFVYNDDRKFQCHQQRKSMKEKRGEKRDDLIQCQMYSLHSRYKGYFIHNS